MWDSCIENSRIQLPYALSWWLDIVSPQWEGLVMDDYAAVMPLTWKHRFGFYYLRQPWFTQQLGIFSAQNLTLEQVAFFLDSIPDKYRFIDIQLNVENAYGLNGNLVSFRANYILDLSADYIRVKSNYHRNCRRNVQKAVHSGLNVKKGPGPYIFSGFIKNNLDRSLSENAGMFETMPLLIQATIDRSYGIIYGVYNHTEELNAAGWFVNIFGRSIFMVCASTEAGKKNQAMSLLVDHVISEKAGTNTVFDFTGSNMQGVAYFNSGFGAVRQLYPVIKKNNLPWMLKLIKK
jgi:hypothetical protein